MMKAHAAVETPKAARYLKALCNHFDRKATAEYTDTRGTVQFGFGRCELNALDHTLLIDVQADDAENFARIKHVVADHLVRFSTDEALNVQWTDSV